MATPQTPEVGIWVRALTSSTRVLGLVALVTVGETIFLLRAERVRPELPPGVSLMRDVVYGEYDNKRLLLDIYAPDGSAPGSGRPALIAIHGGGWCGGSKGEYGRSLAPLVKQGIVLIAVDYRLSRPGAPGWPGNLEDVRAAVRWVRVHASEIGVDPGRLAVIGSSAGGHLALLLGFTGDASTRVSAIIDFYAPTDLRALRADRAASGESVSLLLGSPPEQTPALYDAASPLRQVVPGLPPVLIAHGEDDLLVPLEQSRALASALEQSGVPHQLITIPEARHGFGLVAGRRDLTPEIWSFLIDVWDGAREGRNTDSSGVLNSSAVVPLHAVFPNRVKDEAAATRILMRLLYIARNETRRTMRVPRSTSVPVPTRIGTPGSGTTTACTDTASRMIPNR
jgi:acetyl esterase/lipase